jgi:hypothetical protein
MKFSQLTEQQQLIIQPEWRKWNPALAMEDIEHECETELWRYFIAIESDPEECIALYYALFDPNYQAKLDVFDKLWTILNQLSPPSLNLPLANIFVVTGRISELNTLLEEYSNGLSKG